MWYVGLTLYKLHIHYHGVALSCFTVWHCATKESGMWQYMLAGLIHCWFWTLFVTTNGGRLGLRFVIRPVIPG